MKKLISSTSIALLLLSGSAWAETAAFYSVTNKADGNTIVGFKKEAGEYKKIGEFTTGGNGTGDLEIPALKKDDSHPLLNGDDPLISAGALAATIGRNYMVVVNPGSSNIGLLEVKEDLGLETVSTAPSSDRFPVSVAIYGEFVVAASVGNDNGSGSISAYTITADSKLEPIANSRRDLKARPSTIAFSSDGEHVIVDELVTGKIKVFSMARGNLSKEPVSVIDSPRKAESRFQAIPVGFTVRGNGGDDVLLVSEARFLTPDFKLREEKDKVPQSPLYSWQTGSLSTYHLSDDGKNMSMISGDVLTGSAVEGGEIANCWVALSKDGNHLYAANALSSSISRFDIDAKGAAKLDDVTAFKDQSEALFFSDLEVSRDGKELYQLVGNKGQIMVFDIDNDGGLKLKQTLDGLPQLGTYGMLVY
ncbi:MAG: beta-propeller fold lactonase family protein [Pseudomonadota bacterium]